MNDFLSCDWGTSTLRVSLVNGGTGAVIRGESSDEGMARIYNLWQLTGAAGKDGRLHFYLDVILQHINSIALKLGRPLEGCRLIVSGMASSSIGFMELPYSELPFPLSGEGLKMQRIPASGGFAYDTVVISGVKSHNDVMRGEETQLMGCVNTAGVPVNNHVFILPGTHSKHIYVNNNGIAGFKTFMTGDFFELLSQKSILSSSVEKGGPLGSPEYLKAFLAGVIGSADGNLLHTAFKVRTNSLFGFFTGIQNFHYLSGLLIGTELRGFAHSSAAKIHLLCANRLEPYYNNALKELGFSAKLQTYAPQWVEEAVIRAHFKINHRLQPGHG